jgi:hypothetical protein
MHQHTSSLRKILLEKLNDSSRRNSMSFIEPKGPLPCPQELANVPYPEPEESTTHPPSLR